MQRNLPDTHPMKTRFLATLAATWASLALTLAPAGAWAADNPEGAVDFGTFQPPTEGGQFVEVNVSSGLLAIAAKLTEKQEPEVSELLRGLKSVRVNVVDVDTANREELIQRLQKVRAQLEAGGWERIVTVQEKDQDVAIFVKHRGEEAIEGVVVTVLEGNKQAVFVNVVGDLRPEKIALLGERLNIEPLKKVGKVAAKS